MKQENWRGPFENWHFSPFAIVAMVIGGLALGAALAFLFGWLVMILWNKLMPAIFGLPTIGYWQAWGLLLLSHILIKGGWGHGGGSRGPKGRHGKHGPWNRCGDWHGDWHGRNYAQSESMKEDLASHFMDGKTDVSGDSREDKQS